MNNGERMPMYRLPTDMVDDAFILQMDREYKLKIVLMEEAQWNVMPLK